MGHAEDSVNVKEKGLVEKVLEDPLSGDIGVELVVGERQLELERVFKVHKDSPRYSMEKA